MKVNTSPARGQNLDFSDEALANALRAQLIYEIAGGLNGNFIENG